MEDSSIKGLTEEEALQRSQRSTIRKKTERSYSQIIIGNIFSLFNVLNTAIAVVLIEVGSYKNCMFMLAVISNTLISIVHDIRSKRTLDKLSIINRSTVNVIRSGKKRAVNVEELVSDDIVELESGSQISNDCELVSGNCEVNESLLTGESDLISKKVGDKLLSGSFVVSGKALCRITNIGKNNYADSLLDRIKKEKKPNSEIYELTRKIIVAVSVFIIPLGGLLFYNQYSISENTMKKAIENSSAALLGMIPEGLVLLTSAVFAVGTVRLYKKGVLSHDIYSLEALARTDVLCLDKTGTITTGEMKVEKLVDVEGNYDELKNLINIFASFSEDNNATAKAIKSFSQEKVNCNVTEIIPFSSERKWSAVATSEYGTVIIGAPEFLFENYSLDDSEKKQYRVVAAAQTYDKIENFNIPDSVSLKGYIMLSEQLCNNACELFKYLENQNIQIKIISGDSTDSIEKVCTPLFGENKCSIDLTPEDDCRISELVDNITVFGRATPEQKKQIISALKDKGHTVGMIGDGVNDVLALTESDFSATFLSTVSAARNVSQIIMLDNGFEALPQIVREGRRSINNLQSSASLFLSKTIYSVIITIVFIFFNHSYPLLPIQMTLISALTIGIPSFLLSFQKNDAPIKERFSRKIIENSVPAALTNILAVISAVIISEKFELDQLTLSSLCTAAMAATGVMLIISVYRPLNPLKFFVIAVSLSGFAASFIWFTDFFALALINSQIIAFAAADGVLFLFMTLLVSRLLNHQNFINVFKQHLSLTYISKMFYIPQYFFNLYMRSVKKIHGTSERQ